MKYKKFFNNNISASVILLPDGKIVDCNRSFIKLFGYKTKKDALGANVNELYIDKTKRKNFIEAIKKAKVIKNLLINYKTTPGKIITVRENIVGIFGKSGKLEYLLAFLQDITREEELQTQLMQAQKMESLGRITGGIAHDLNNMLVPIKGYTDILLLQTPKDSPIYSKLKGIEKATDRATALLKEILAFSKKQILNIETLDLNKEIKRFSDILQKIIGEKINFNIILQPKELMINADKTQIDQILMNLAANARDAMPQGGTLTIETSEVNLDTVYTSRHVNIQPGIYIHLAITDTGTGMDNKTVNMIFEPFFTTKSKGTGLGLSTVYGIVKQHKGYILVYSEPGHGTTFKIYFPKSRKRLGKNTNKKIPMKDFIAGNESILLVEDEEDVRKVIKEILTQYGYTVYETGSPSEALEMVKQGGKLDLLITDVVLPDMNGKELSNAIKKENDSIKILYMSGYTSNVIAHEKILDKGINFIHKPFSITNLLIKVRGILESD
ncbi:MAG: response regulator [Proteobacteria bacterium]|nr:response regulator [Pseudomonadota bacterium]